MTPETIKAKGDELVEKFRAYANTVNGEMNYTNATHCAITAVEEIIKVLDSDSFYAVNINDEEKFIPVEDYLNEVLNYLKSKQ